MLVTMEQSRGHSLEEETLSRKSSPLPTSEPNLKKSFIAAQSHKI